MTQWSVLILNITSKPLTSTQSSVRAASVRRRRTVSSSDDDSDDQLLIRKKSRTTSKYFVPSQNHLYVPRREGLSEHTETIETRKVRPNLVLVPIKTNNPTSPVNPIAMDLPLQPTSGDLTPVPRPYHAHVLSETPLVSIHSAISQNSLSNLLQVPSNIVLLRTKV